MTDDTEWLRGLLLDDEQQGFALNPEDRLRFARILDRLSVMEEALRLLKMWRGLVTESDGVPRYTIVPGAALNSLVTWTDAALAAIKLEGVGEP